MTFHLFPTNTYSSRRKELMAAMGGGVILIPGNETSPFNYKANYYRFRQDSHFLYFAGIDLPGLNLVIDAGKGKTILYGDEQTIEDQIWSGAKETLASLASRVGIDEVWPTAKLIPDCASCEIQTVHPYRNEHFVLLQQINEHADCSVAPSLKLMQAIIALREIKTAEEIGQLEEALHITAQMHKKVMQSAKPGIKEAQLAGIAQGIATANEVMTAYGIILSKDGDILHNEGHDNILKEGDLVLGDFGAESRMHYAGDITRTFPVSKTFSTKQKEIYELVLDAQMKAIQAVQPGRMYKDIHLQVAHIITDGLKALGLMKGDTESAVAEGAHALFFPHGLGHMIGLDVHDMEGLGEDYVGYDEHVRRSDQFGLGYLRMAKGLRPGHVITVEPGIYFIPTLIDKWRAGEKHLAYINYDLADTYKGFGGVRIEDNVLVTERGHRVLGPPIAKTVRDVESLRG